MIGLVLALIAPACTGGAPPATPVAEPDLPAFAATVRIDPAPSAKRFQGVWLDREGHDALLIDYRASSCWTPFDGHVVQVTGRSWAPDPRAQQIDAPHFEVATLSLPSPSPEVALHAVGPEQTLSGQVQTLAGEPGTKMEGSTWTAFAAEGGTTWQIWGAPEGLPHDTPVTVTARAVEVSPFSAHMAGPTLWIRDYESAR